MKDAVDPIWVPSPASSMPLLERAAASKAAADALSKEISHQRFREAVMKAMVDLGDTSHSAQVYVAQRMWRPIVWHLWRSGNPEKRQAARLMLKMLKAGRAGRPTTEHKRMKLALQVKDEIDRRRKEGPLKKRINNEHLYGIIAAQTGEKPDYQGCLSRVQR